MKTSRDIRQEECVRKWIQAKCLGSWDLCPGFGKTRCACIAINWFVKKNPDHHVLIVVPPRIEEQWNNELKEFFKDNLSILDNIQLITINKVLKKMFNVGLLILDEFHELVSEVRFRIFDQVKYSTLLCLSGTIRRVDKKESLILDKAPVVDTISMTEAMKNGWISSSNHYVVLLDVDRSVYNAIHTEFLKQFSYFNYSLPDAMNCLKGGATGKSYRAALANKLGKTENEIYVSALNFMRVLRKRKTFVQEHPHKIEIVNKILKNRPNNKAITFSKTVRFAKQIKYGTSLSSKCSPKEMKTILDAYKNNEIRILNTVDALNKGFDDKEIDLAIIVSGDSSNINNVQRISRATRKNEDKVAEIFHLVINGTQEMKWVKSAVKGLDVIYITEEELDNILEYKSYKQAKKSEQIEIKF